MRPLRFLCFNIHGGRSLNGKRDLQRVHDLMDAHDVDIGVFQEMETRPSYGGRAEDVDILAGESRPHHLPGPSMKEGLGWYGNLIVSRYPIARALVHNLETSGGREPRNAVDALVETPLGPVRVIGTHLSLSIFERLSEARNLLRLMAVVEMKERNPMLLMGDINEWQWPSRLLRFLDREMVPLPCGPTFPSFAPFLRLDRAWYDSQGMQVRARVLGSRRVRRLSDHLPLLIEIDDLGRGK